MAKFWPLLSMERLQRLRSLLLPGTGPPDETLLRTLAATMRQSLVGPTLVFAALFYLAYETPRIAWLFAISVIYLFVAFQNQRRIQQASLSLKLDVPTPPNLLRLIFVKNIATYLSLSVLMGAIPWVIGPVLSAYGELTMTMILISYVLLLAFVHSAFPWTVLIFASVVSHSLIAYWLSTSYDFKFPVAALTLVFFALLLHSTFRLGRILRQSLVLQVERDDARLRAENAAFKLEQALSSLRLLSAEKTRLFAAANHDLRQPISAISLFVGVLQRKLGRRPEGVEPEINNLFDKVDRNIQTLDGIVSSLADFTSMESGSFQPKPIFFDLHRHVREVAQEFERQIESKQTPIQVEVDSRAMYADASMLARVLRNVLDNALKYAQGRDVKISVLMRVTPNSHAVLEPWLSVRDHGPGIPDEFRSQVFDEYVQMANPERDRKKGYGLGLSIVKRLADTLGAQIELREPLGGGLEFLINLAALVAPKPTPALEPISGLSLPSLGESNSLQLELALPSAAVSSSQSGAWGLQLGGAAAKKIIVVDDDDDVRAGLVTMFELWGCEVMGFGNMTQALEYLRSLKSEGLPQHILLDNWLPDARAVDCVQMIKSLSPGSHLSLVTGDTDQATLVRALQLGMQVLHKPVKPDDLALLIK